MFIQNSGQITGGTAANQWTLLPTFLTFMWETAMSRRKTSQKKKKKGQQKKQKEREGSCGKTGVEDAAEQQHDLQMMSDSLKTSRTTYQLPT